MLGEGEEVNALLEEERDISPSNFTCSALIASLVGNNDAEYIYDHYKKHLVSNVI